MTSGGRDERTAPPRRRRTRSWLLAAALLAAALLVVLWFETPHDADRSSAASTAPAENGALPTFALPSAPGAPPVDVAASDAVPAPAALAVRPASLDVRVDEPGLLVTDPFVQLNRADGWWNALELGTDRHVAWDGLAPGSYRLETIGAAWCVSEAAIELSSGEARATVLQPAHRANVRVAGVRSGRPVPAHSFDVHARHAPGNEDFELVRPMLVDAETGRFTLLGIPPFGSGGPVAEVRIEVDSGRDAWTSSDWISLDALEDGDVLVPGAEAAIVGRVVRQPAGAGSQPKIDVFLIPARANLAEARNALRALGDDRVDPTSDTVATCTASPADGSYHFDLARAPAEPMRVVALDALDVPADSGALTIPATGAPLRVDLVLRLGGAIHGVLLSPLATTAAGELAPMFVINGLQARRVDAAAPDFLPHVETSCSWGSGELQGVPPSRATTAFDVRGLASGEYEIALRTQPDAILAGPPAVARQLKRRVSVTEGQTTELLLDAAEPPAGALLRGSVRLPEALAGASVGIEVWPAGADPHGEVGLATRANASLRFALADVPPGAFTLLAVTYDGRGREAVAWMSAVMGSESVDLPPLDLSRPELRLHTARGGSRLTVSGTAGHPILDQMLADGWFSPTTDDTGTAWIFGLPPGHYAASNMGGPLVEFDLAAGVSSVSVEVPDVFRRGSTLLR